MRNLRTVQWNIGGGKIRSPEANPLAQDSYTEEGLEYVIDFLVRHNPDVILLQETHARDGYSQTKIIAEALGYEGQVNDSYDESHLEEGSMLGLGIISRFPIVDHTSVRFTNPRLTTTWRGKEIATHDKGVTSAALSIGGGALFLAQTLHPIPFDGFGVDLSSPEGQAILADMQARILQSWQGPSTLQGDFNIDTASLRSYFPELFRRGFREVEQHETTRPVHGRFDHVLFSGMTAIRHTVHASALTDHYPVTAELMFDRF